MKDIIIITGPTAVGKTEFTLKLAEKFGTEIINADSRQIYKYMDIGTAKPTIDEQRRVKHHLIDIIEPTEKYSAGQFVEDTDRIINEKFTDNAVIISGGTGLYLKSYRDGIFEGPKGDNNIREKIKKEIEEKGLECVHQKLTEIDPQSAKKIHFNDKQRLTRALEVYYITGKPITYWHKNAKDISRTEINPLLITLTRDRKSLYPRINQRVTEMVKSGLIEETEKLLKNFDEKDYGLNSIGYKETIAYLKNEITKMEMTEKIQQNTRNYAKRQMTFFRGMEDNNFFDIETSTFDKIYEFIKTKIER